MPATTASVSFHLLHPADERLLRACAVTRRRFPCFGTGTYKVEGNKVVYQCDSSWHHAWVGVERTTQLPALSGTEW
jgi:hypothetical protein